MEQLFWIGQVGWIAFLACGAYVSFSFYELADEEHARTAQPRKPAPHAMSAEGARGFAADGV